MPESISVRMILPVLAIIMLVPSSRSSARKRFSEDGCWCSGRLSPGSTRCRRSLSCDNADYDEFDNGETKLSDNSDSFLNDGCVRALCFKNYALKEVAGCGYLS